MLCRYALMVSAECGLPRIGSVKLAHTLPQGIPFEAHIKRQAWTLVSEPEVLESAHRVGHTGQAHTDRRGGHGYQPTRN